MNRRDFLRLGPLAAISLLDIPNKEQDFWDEVQNKIDSFNIKRKGVVEYRPIGEHYALTKSGNGGNYIYSPDFFHFEVAREWGLTPDELTARSNGEQIEMYAYVIAIRQVVAIEQWEERQKARKKK